MPDFYAPGEYDLAGFIVGVVDRSRLIDGSRIRPGDVLLGLSSAGLHTNGYSLARRLFFERLGLGPADRVPELDATVAEILLAPHRSYYGLLEPLLDSGVLRGMAHITGGGITDNLPRVLPAGSGALVRRGSWPVTPVFKFIQRQGAVDDTEMYRTFNMGIGMIAVVAGRTPERSFRSSLRAVRFVIGLVRSFRVTARSSTLIDRRAGLILACRMLSGHVGQEGRSRRFHAHSDRGIPKGVPRQSPEHSPGAAAVVSRPARAATSARTRSKGHRMHRPFCRRRCRYRSRFFCSAPWKSATATPRSSIRPNPRLRSTNCTGGLWLLSLTGCMPLEAGSGYENGEFSVLRNSWIICAGARSRSSARRRQSRSLKNRSGPGVPLDGQSRIRSDRAGPASRAHGADPEDEALSGSRAPGDLSDR